MAAPNLLGALDQADIGDLAGAIKQDPTLLQPPDRGVAGELAVAANNVTRFFGLLFNDQSAIRVAEVNRQEDEQRDADAVQQKLIPVIAAGRAERLNQARQDKLEQQQQAHADKLAALQEKAQNDYVIDDGKGNIRPLNMDEVSKMINGWANFASNPGAGLNHEELPAGVRPWTEMDKQAAIAKRQADLQDMIQRHSDERLVAAKQASEAKAEKAAKLAEDKATAGEAVTEHKRAVSDYRRDSDQIATEEREAARKSGLDDQAESNAKAARLSLATARAETIARDSIARKNGDLIRAVAADLDKKGLDKFRTDLMRGFIADGEIPAQGSELDKILDSMAPRRPGTAKPQAPSGPVPQINYNPLRNNAR